MEGEIITTARQVINFGTKFGWDALKTNWLLQILIFASSHNLQLSHCPQEGSEEQFCLIAITNTTMGDFAEMHFLPDNFSTIADILSLVTVTEKNQPSCLQNQIQQLTRCISTLEKYLPSSTPAQDLAAIDIEALKLRAFKIGNKIFVDNGMVKYWRQRRPAHPGEKKSRYIYTIQDALDARWRHTKNVWMFKLIDPYDVQQCELFLAHDEQIYQDLHRG